VALSDKNLPASFRPQPEYGAPPADGPFSPNVKLGERSWHSVSASAQQLWFVTDKLYVSINIASKGAASLSPQFLEKVGKELERNLVSGAVTHHALSDAQLKPLALIPPLSSWVIGAEEWKIEPTRSSQRRRLYSGDKWLTVTRTQFNSAELALKYAPGSMSFQASPPVSGGYSTDWPPTVHVWHFKDSKPLTLIIAIKDGTLVQVETNGASPDLVESVAKKALGL